MRNRVVSHRQTLNEILFLPARPARGGGRACPERSEGSRGRRGHEHQRVDSDPSVADYRATSPRFAQRKSILQISTAGR